MAGLGWPAFLLRIGLGANELVGGAAGLYVAVPLYLRAARYLPPVNQALILFGIALFVLAILAGLLLIDGRRQGWVMSMWVQALQVLGLQTTVFLYDYLIGFYGRVTTEATRLGALNLTVGAGFDAAVTIGPAANVTSFVVTLNFLAIVSLVLLWWLKPRLLNQPGRR